MKMLAPLLALTAFAAPPAFASEHSEAGVEAIIKAGRDIVAAAIDAHFEKQDKQAMDKAEKFHAEKTRRLIRIDKL